MFLQGYFVQLRIAKVNPILLLSTCSTLCKGVECRRGGFGYDLCPAGKHGHK